MAFLARQKATLTSVDIPSSALENNFDDPGRLLEKRDRERQWLHRVQNDFTEVGLPQLTLIDEIRVAWGDDTGECD